MKTSSYFFVQAHGKTYVDMAKLNIRSAIYSLYAKEILFAKGKCFISIDGLQELMATKLLPSKTSRAITKDWPTLDVAPSEDWSQFALPDSTHLFAQAFESCGKSHILFTVDRCLYVTVKSIALAFNLSWKEVVSSLNTEVFCNSCILAKYDFLPLDEKAKNTLCVLLDVVPVWLKAASFESSTDIAGEKLTSELRDNWGICADKVACNKAIAKIQLDQASCIGVLMDVKNRLAAVEQGLHCLSKQRGAYFSSHSSSLDFVFIESWLSKKKLSDGQKVKLHDRVRFLRSRGQLEVRQEPMLIDGVIEHRDTFSVESLDKIFQEVLSGQVL